MTITRYDYFYDAQTKRFLMQLVRGFSGFQYMTGARGSVAPQLLFVPVTLAKRSKQAAAIQRNMSENTLLSVPQMTVDLTDMEFNREALQNPNFVEQVQVTEREIDPVTGEFTGRRGNSMTIDRQMPVPFIMSVNIDLWTSNQDQKFQIVEQILRVITPGFDIQNSDNALDWTARTTATMDSFRLSSLSIPIGGGGENEIDIATFTLKIPIWITGPALIHQQRLIQQVVTNINSGTRDENGVLVSGDLLNRVITTPGDYQIKVDRGYLTLLGPKAAHHDDQGNVFPWDDLFHLYDLTLYPSETQITLRRTTGDDHSEDMKGTVQPTAEPNVLYWSPDIETLPKNTIASVAAVIDPTRSFPSDGALPEVAEGQRYLLIEDLAEQSLAWGNISAREGSIIQYNNGAWVIAFNAVNYEQQEYVTNRMTGRQLRWSVDHQGWVDALDGVYGDGYWRLNTQ